MHPVLPFKIKSDHNENFIAMSSGTDFSDYEDRQMCPFFFCTSLFDLFFHLILSFLRLLKFVSGFVAFHFCLLFPNIRKSMKTERRKSTSHS